MRIERNIHWILFIPGFIVLIFVIVAPLIFNYVIMFFKWHLVDPFERNPVFIGLNNFADIFFEGTRFWKAWSRTLIFTGLAVTMEFILGLIAALALDKVTVFTRIIRSCMLFPLAIAPVAAGAIWRVIFNPTYGVTNYLLGFLKIPPQPWVTSVEQALTSSVLVDVWQWTPFVALVLLAGLRSLPPEPFEAAKIDGASSFQIFRYLTLPMLRNVILVILILRIMDAIKTYDIFYSLTYGGPGASTTLITWHISETAFRRWRIGLAAAESILTAVIISILIMIYLRIMRQR